MTTTPSGAGTPAALLELLPGDTISFHENRTVFTVRSATENFVAAAGQSHGKSVYTIIDWRRSRRGPHDSWVYPMIEGADIDRALTALENSKPAYDGASADPATGTEDNPWPHPELELSVRECVPLNILSVHRGTTTLWPAP